MFKFLQQGGAVTGLIQAIRFADTGIEITIGAFGQTPGPMHIQRKLFVITHLACPFFWAQKMRGGVIDLCIGSLGSTT